MNVLLLRFLITLAAVQATPAKKENACGHKCWQHTSCPDTMACISHKCTDPCVSRCGYNTVCKVASHIPVCACKPGYTGNPFDKCEQHTDAPCPPSSLGNWPPNTDGTKKFYVETLKKFQADWHGALMACMKRGQQLASIMTEKELEDAKNAIKLTDIRGEQFWLAGTDHLYENDWIWVTTNKTFTELEDWGKNQPDSDGEDCLEFWESNRQIGYKWNDRNCHEKHYFICEYYE